MGAWGGRTHVYRILALILTAGFTARVAVALVSENMLWPDEIFQYLEQGHRLVFGYGYIPWEYHYAARSWLLPGFIAFWLWLCEVAGLDAPTFYVPFIKIVFCALSTTLIYSAYCVARNIAGHFAGLIAALLIAGWYELIYLAHKPLTEVVATYALVPCLALATKRQASRWDAIGCGLLGGLTCALRIQYALCVLVIGVYGLLRWRCRVWLQACFAWVAALFLAGAVDRVTWGGWFETYVTSYRLNAVLHVSDWFGTEPMLWYVGALSVTSAGLIWVPLCLGWVRQIGLTRLPVLCAAVVLISHSIISHKEYRFITAAVPLGWLTGAILLGHALAARTLRQSGAVAIIAIFFGISALGLSYRLPGQASVYRAGALLARWPNLEAYLALSADPDLRGLLSTDDRRFLPPFVGTGGYYYLHRHVPIYFPSELIAMGVRRAELQGVVTHALSPRGSAAFEGFTSGAGFGSLEIRKRASDSGPVRRVCLSPLAVEAFVDHALSAAVAPVSAISNRCP